MKIDYMLLGLDEGGKTTLELDLTAEQVVQILADFIKKGQPAADEEEDEEEPAPAPRPKKKYKKRKVFTLAELEPTRANKEAAPGKRGRAISQEKKEQIIALCQAGKTKAEILEETGVSAPTVYRILTEAGLKNNRAKKETAAATHKSELTEEVKEKILVMRRDGYSASYIHVDLGIAQRSVVSKVIAAAGIVDKKGSAPDARYPLRCAKCKEFGHRPEVCTNGDALDQMDRAAGWQDPKRDTMSVGHFQQVKIAHSHQLPEDTIAQEMGLALEEVAAAVRARTYDEYCR